MDILVLLIPTVIRDCIDSIPNFSEFNIARVGVLHDSSNQFSHFLNIPNGPEVLLRFLGGRLAIMLRGLLDEFLGFSGKIMHSFLFLLALLALLLLFQLLFLLFLDFAAFITPLLLGILDNVPPV